MSFILDALKKSEAERQRQIAPGLMVSPTAPARRRLPPWAVALLGLLALNLVVLGAVFLRRTPPAQPPIAAPAVPATARSVGVGGTPRAAQAPPVDDAPVFAPEVPVGAADNPIVAAARARLDAKAPPSARPPPHDAAADEAPAQAAALPTLAMMHFDGDALPPLHLDVHVYAADPAARFVYINARKYTEGSTLREGPTLVRIRRDGVVLEYRGKRFLLPRQ